MKIVHYEYRLNAYTKDGEIGVQLVAKPIVHYSDLDEFMPADDLMPVRQPRKRKAGQVASRYYFGIVNKEIVKPASEPGFNQQYGDHKLKSRRSKESWSTCLRK